MNYQFTYFMNTIYTRLISHFNTLYYQQRILFYLNKFENRRQPMLPQKCNEVGYSPDPLVSRNILDHPTSKAFIHKLFHKVSDVPVSSPWLRSSIQNSFTSSLRILNPPQQKSKTSGSDSQSQSHKNQLAFGSSEIRQVKIFQQIKGQALEESTNKFQSILSNSYSKCKSAEKTSANSFENSLSAPPLYETRIGFGNGGPLARNQPKLRSNLPGPGSYEISQSFNNIKDKRLLSRFGKSEDQKKSRLNEMYGSENLKHEPKNAIEQKTISQFERNKIRQEMKQKWRQTLFKKRLKTEDLFAKMKPRKQNLPNLEQMAKLRQLQKRKQHQPNENAKDQKYSTQHDHKAHHLKAGKLLRKELWERTNQFLGAGDGIGQDNYEGSGKGPLYKFMFSNSFIKKNDHAFEAHSYKVKEKESQYILIKGRPQIESKTGESCFFKSKIGRAVF